MTARVAINGFGRIGRLGLRTILERHKKDPTVERRSWRNAQPRALRHPNAGTRALFLDFELPEPRKFSKDILRHLGD